MDFDLLLSLALLIHSAAGQDSDAIHTWPLSNLTLYKDIAGNSHVIHDSSKRCFSFVPGPTELDYSVMKMSEENSHFDMTLPGDSILKDLSISLFVYPNAEETELSGTLLHYTYEEREIMRIRCLANTFLVSFRDEYGMSAGMMYLENFLQPEQWNHVIVTRDYKTGRITVFLNGEEKYNEDDDFSDIISFPGGGKIRIGKSQDPDDVDGFGGNFACIQMFEKVLDADDADTVQDNCIVDEDDYKEVYYVEKDGKFCLTKRPPPPPEIKPGHLVSMTTLSNQLHWQAFLDQFGLDDSGETNQRFRLESRDKKSSSVDDMIGQFNVTDKKVCTRLCMRVDTCESFLIEAVQDNTAPQTCTLYSDAAIDLTEDSAGAKYYAVLPDKK